MVASKFLNDEGEEDEVFNTDWANSAKMDIKELNKLEREFLTAIVNIYRYMVWHQSFFRQFHEILIHSLIFLYDSQPRLKNS